MRPRCFDGGKPASLTSNTTEEHPQSGHNAEPFDSCGADEPSVSAGEGDGLLEQLVHEHGRCEMHCIGAAECMASEKAIDAAMDIVIERDARERVEVALKGCVQLVDGEDDHRLSSITISEAGLPATATGGTSVVEER